MFPRSALLLLTAAATLLVAGSGQAPAAQHGRHGRPSVRILSPKADARIGKRVVVRVRARGPRFRAYLNGRDVTRHFRRTGKLRTAVLDRGRDYGIGDVSLFVRTGLRGAAAARFGHYYSVRRRDRSVRLKVSWSRRLHAAPRLHLRSRRPLRDFKVWLNGSRVDASFKVDGDGRGVAARLAPHDGLRYGRNRIVFTALQRGGTLAHVSHTFRIGHYRPLADAGPDRRGAVGRPVMLDASGSRSDGPGKALSYHWQVLRAPAGSQAAVAHPGARRSRFVPDVAGTYVLRVAARDGRGRRRSVDETRVSVAQTLSPMGVPIQTRTSSGGIQLGSTAFPALKHWVQMLVLDDGTGAPASGPWGEANQGFESTESAKLLEKVRQTTGNQLVVLSGSCCTGSSEPKPASENLRAAIEYLGGTVQSWGPTPHGAEDLWIGRYNSDWSLIGHAGLTRGAADQNFSYTEAGIPGFLGGSGGEPGSLNGYLQTVTTRGYEFVSPESVPIDTKWTPSSTTPPSPTKNVIAVGEAHYESATIENGAVAIQLLELDPSNLALLSNNTFGVLKPNGETDFGGIYGLDKALHEINANHEPGYSPLVVLQDFGEHRGWDWPGGNSTDWLQDTMPATKDSREWSGNPFPNGTEQLFYSWNEANVHGFGSVAGNLGELVGISFHDVVANYRRPYYDPAGNGAKIERTTGGLTAIAEPHLYQWSSAFGQGQGSPALSGNSTLANGRVTGTLVRNEQSQWELASAANGAGFELSGNPAGSENDLLEPQALWSLAFQPSVPWPCSTAQPAPCPRRPAEIAAADRYIAARLFGPDVLDVRAMYTKTESWNSLHNEMYEKAPYAPGRGFSPEVLSSLEKQLSIEFDYLEEVKTGIDSWQNVIAASGNSANVDINAAAGDVTASVQEAARELLARETQVDVAATTSDSLLVASSIIDLGLSVGIGPEALAFAPPALGGISAMLALGDDLFGEGTSEETTPSESQELVADNTAAIRDKVGNLTQDLTARYNAINLTMGHFQDVFASDWGKLSAAAAKFKSVWSLDSEEQKLVGQTISVGAEQQLYVSTIPIAYSQWIVSPQETDINSQGALEPPADEYGCRPEGDSRGSNGNFVNRGEPIGATTAVGWTANPRNGYTPYTLRFLKPWTNNMDVKTTSDFNGLGTPDTFVPYSGGTPPASLFNPLFEPVSVTENPLTPHNLGMSKDAFFGEQMGMQQLQCGAVMEWQE